MAFGGTFLDVRWDIIQRSGPFIYVVGTQAKIDMALLILNVRRVSACQCRDQQLRAIHIA